MKSKHAEFQVRLVAEIVSVQDYASEAIVKREESFSISKTEPLEQARAVTRFCEQVDDLFDLGRQFNSVQETHAKLLADKESEQKEVRF